jgi:hypothetical protein
MWDFDAFTVPLPPPTEPRATADTPPPEWHALSWRPAGSMHLAERWLKAGETQPSQAPPNLRRKR